MLLNHNQPNLALLHLLTEMKCVLHDTDYSRNYALVASQYDARSNQTQSNTFNHPQGFVSSQKRTYATSLIYHDNLLSSPSRADIV